MSALPASHPLDGAAVSGAVRARIATAGAGRMGRGIALAFAWGGHEVALIDLKPRDAAACVRASSVRTTRARQLQTAPRPHARARAPIPQGARTPARR